MKNAFLSLYDTEKPGSEVFAAELIKLGFKIISSGGTAKYLQRNEIPVTDISEITGYGPVLDHCVVTLHPQIHGGLQARSDLLPELAELEWPKIDLVYVTFYPLQKELDREGSTLESCIKQTDIGGPTMIRSANKSGRTIPMVRKDQEDLVLTMLRANGVDQDQLFLLRAVAEEYVVDYVTLSSKVYKHFAQ